MSQGPHRGNSAVPRPEQISEATIQRMLSLQEQRVTLELKQLDVSIREIDHNQKIADKSIQAQAEDRKDDRLNDRTMQMHRLAFAAFVAILIVALVVVALAYDKEALAMDVLKILAGVAGGWGGSLAWHSRNRKTDD